MTEQEHTDGEPIKVIVKAKKLSAKEITYCYKLLEGLNATEAALASGFKQSIAENASRWIREDREHSSRPHLYDYFTKLLKAKLRHYDVNVDNVLKELVIIAFSTLKHFIDIPTRAELTQDAIEARVLNYDINQPDQANEWKKLRAGSIIKLKPGDEIPDELWPAIAELSETSDGGIKIKMHNKIQALEKLVKYLGMYQNASADPDDIGQSVKEINLIVEGSKSPLMQLIKGGNLPEVKSA